jgi:hypothetical protein
MGFLSDFWRGVCGIPSAEHYASERKADGGKVIAAEQEYRRTELTAVSHNSCLPLWMWKGVVMVTDDKGTTHAVEKSAYDLHTLGARRKLEATRNQASRNEYHRNREEGDFRPPDDFDLY